MEFFRQWLLGVVACAIFVSMVIQLCPEGSGRKLARFTGALLLLCAMLRPLTEWDLPESAWDAGSYRAAVAQLELELRGAEENALADGIAAGLASYIEDKADSMDANVRATVTVEPRDGACIPTGVTLRGAYNGEIAAFVERELGITKERQVWIDS